MKYLFVSLVVSIFSAQSFAADTEIVLYRTNFRNYTRYAKSDAARECREQLSPLIKEVEINLAINKYSQAINGDVQYACRKVVFKTGTQHTSSWGTNHGLYHTLNTELTVTCEPRTLVEKQLYSIARRCEENPTPDCSNEKLLKKVSKLQNTKYIYSYSGSCSL